MSPHRARAVNNTLQPLHEYGIMRSGNYGGVHNTDAYKRLCGNNGGSKAADFGNDGEVVQHVDWCLRLS